MNEIPNTQDLLSEYEIKPVPASHGKRMANYIIDFIFYCFLFVMGLYVAAAMGYAQLPQPNQDPMLHYSFTDRMLITLGYSLFMSLQEGLFRGRSLGKLFTGTRAVRMDGSPLNFDLAMWRGLVRAVPFNPISALGMICRPWHDRWTKTMVVDLKKSTLPK
jgi:uncharacterized RDD family membrane protein YckC